MWTLWVLYQGINQGEAAERISTVTGTGNDMWWVRFLSDNGVAITSLVVIALFFGFKVWPFFTDRWFPAQIARENARDQTLGMLSAAVVELKTSNGALVTLMNKQIDTQTRIEVALAVLAARRGRRSPSGEKVDLTGGQA